MAMLRTGPMAYQPGSLLWRFRTQRFAMFENWCADMPRPLTILDIGGTTAFWEMHGWAGRSDVRITLLNLRAEAQRHANIDSVAGDATHLAGYGDGSFTVAFSNSTIEHLFTLENQRRMAAEVRRVGRAYWVQTPNFWFPIEPHFQCPGWQWLPVSVRIWLIQRRRFGWRGPCADRESARRAIEEIRLLTRRGMRELFPDATLRAERFLGMVKSWIAIRGASSPAQG